MEQQFITRYRFFLVHKYKDEEAWLESMSKNGWHLVNVFLGIRFTFVKGDPIDYKYTLDYRKDCELDNDYLQLFHDAGWEYIGRYLRWRYFRALKDNSFVDMFNDNTDLIDRNNHLIGILSLILGFNLCVFIINFFFFLNKGDLNLRTSLLNLGVVLLLGHVIKQLKSMNKELE